MKLKSFNATNVRSARSQGRAINMNSKSGIISISAELASEMNVSDGDSVEFHQDEDNPKDWFISKAIENGFKCRLKKELSNSVMFNSTGMVRTFFKSIDFNETSGKMIVGKEITDLPADPSMPIWSIITKSIN